ncbi:MAG: nickel pincer cofactor biosynthesis protein LarB [Miniphocaeibacter sp.]|uniref:nickel pincer cofactor biosynthesis protein LarB n=1 Tax=Miniphocaeibacter sp. TaxID=3100973 RepID=UPI0017C2B65E|nr:nickel pincer cofactor biosynthesis protein LarB [Gallicola sp.]
MNDLKLMNLLKEVQNGGRTPEEVLESIRTNPFTDLGYAKIDNERKMRQGVQEVIYGAGKSIEQIDGIVKSMLENNYKNIIITRLNEEYANILKKKYNLTYSSMAKFGIVNYEEERDKKGNIVIASAGTSDMSVSEEAALTAEVLGNNVTRLYDVGVAGLHRLLAHLPSLNSARVIIAIAGMEGALPSVIGGLVSCPIIAVPTSVGYGSNLRGVTTLLAMLNSCASGVSVVNIDNGFGAGFIASRINKMESVK